MKKIIVALLAFAVVFMASLMAAPAYATPERAEGKDQTICHFTSENASHQYNKITVPVESILQQNGHAYHDGGRDIIPAFTYYEGSKEPGKDWVWTEKQFPGQGDTSLLAFENCEKPKTDTEIAVPAVNKVDVCEVEGDSVTPVRDDEKYTTEVGERVGDSVTVTFTAKDGFVFPDNKKVVTVTVDFPNNDDCDLPETGGEAQYNTTLGLLALLGVGGLAIALLFRRKHS